MTRVLIWDLPTRLFHWLLAAAFAVAAFIALGLGEESPLFPYHAMLGLTIALMLALRLVWGFIGTRYARFGSFLHGPGALAEYVRDAIRGGGRRHLGHNPGSAYAVFAMLLLLAGLAVTGFMLGRGNEGVKEVHEFLAYVTLAVVGVHLAGIALHTVRHRENIAATMVHGRKEAEAGEGIASGQPVVAAAFLAICGAWLTGLVASYDAAGQTTRIPLTNISLQLGEHEDEEQEYERGRGTRWREHEDEDDDD